METQTGTKASVQIIDEKTAKKYEMSHPTIDFLLKDPELEEIMVNGPNQTVFIYHRKYGMCETNLVMKENEILNLIAQTAKLSEDHIDENKPFLDARLDDGSRFNATIPPATPWGATITIRKFREQPLSIIHLIKNNTLTAAAAAFLWMAVEGEKNYPLNMLVIGGAGSGKTTTLNILSAFVPIEDRIVVIEDTLELNFYGRKNVVRMESTPGSKERKAVTMNDLLINALRMRPNRLIMGEVRGPEAESLFNAMNVGHSAMGTLHANSPSECIARLTNSPMEVPTNMLPLMDLIVVTQKIRSPQGLKRRVTQIVEVEKSEVGVSFSEIFLYDPKKDIVERTDIPSKKEEELAKLAGIEIVTLKKRIQDKEKLLEALASDDITEFKTTLKEIQNFALQD